MAGTRLSRPRKANTVNRYGENVHIDRFLRLVFEVVNKQAKRKGVKTN